MKGNYMEEEKQDYRSTIHGHVVNTDADDKDSRRYLRSLDTDEAKTIFNQARVHGNAEFETRQRGMRENHSAQYEDGRYTVRREGKEKSGSSWF